MKERVKGNWKVSEEDKKLQEKFKSIWPYNDLFSGVLEKDLNKSNTIIPNIGAHFLRKNSFLLD